MRRRSLRTQVQFRYAQVSGGESIPALRQLMSRRQPPWQRFPRPDRPTQSSACHHPAMLARFTAFGRLSSVGMAVRWGQFSCAAVGVAVLGGCLDSLRGGRSDPPEPPPQFVFQPPPPTAPAPVNAPWHVGLEACKPPTKSMGATWTAAGDVDGDGRADFLDTVCDGQAGVQRCYQRLCLATALGGFVYAAAWESPQQEEVVGLESRTVPRDFEAFVVRDEAPGVSCVRGRRFAWGEGGYVSTPHDRCVCRSLARVPVPANCRAMSP